MIDVEIKARCSNHDVIREILKKQNARFGGIDKQIDVYFHTRSGRLKLRKGQIENSLVFYDRENIQGIKPSEFQLYKSNDPSSLEKILRASLGVLIEVKKKREMYFINNIKFNLDEVTGLGQFLEIEAMTEDHNEIESLHKIVESYILLFGIKFQDIQSHSYSDLLLKTKQKTRGDDQYSQ
ncbi:MAG: class IV adenylate cyclase [Candidatus Heimdallarchaeota archaeon]|nr:class IV adenylate cyclase [Candidatus Heimdallarchaeota archaeon]